MSYRFAHKLSAKLYDIISLLGVQWKTPVDEQRNCPKHVEFYSKNKFAKLVHLVSFIIRAYTHEFCAQNFEFFKVNPSGSCSNYYKTPWP